MLDSAITFVFDVKGPFARNQSLVLWQFNQPQGFHFHQRVVLSICCLSQVFCIRASHGLFNRTVFRHMTDVVRFVNSTVHCIKFAFAAATAFSCGFCRNKLYKPVQFLILSARPLQLLLRLWSWASAQNPLGRSLYHCLCQQFHCSAGNCTCLNHTCAVHTLVHNMEGSLRQ